MANEPIHIVIELDGGLVQAVHTDLADVDRVRVIVIDYDTEGGDPERMSTFTDTDGSTRDVYMTGIVPESNPVVVSEAFRILEEETE